MATLHIKRKTKYNSGARKFKLMLDGAHIGDIGNGVEKEVDLAAGQHTIVAKIDWCSSMPFTFTVSENETKEIIVSTYSFDTNLYLALIVLLVAHLLCKALFNFEYLLYPIGLLGLIFFYMISFGRKRFLEINEK
jgi:hypothetical protein